MDGHLESGNAGRHSRQGKSQDRFRGADSSIYMAYKVKGGGGRSSYHLQGAGPKDGKLISEQGLRWQ